MIFDGRWQFVEVVVVAAIPAALFWLFIFMATHTPPPTSGDRE